MFGHSWRLQDWRLKSKCVCAGQMSYTKDTAVAKTAFWSAYLPGNAESPMKIALRDAIKRDPTPAEMAFRYRYNEPAQCHKCHACHANTRPISPSATRATPNASGCHQAPRLPRKKTAASPATSADQARHKSQPSATSATPATQTQGLSHQVYHAFRAKCLWMCQVPRLPRKRPRCHWQPAQEPAQCHNCHACHANARPISQSATPATQRPRRHQARHKSQPSATSATPAPRLLRCAVWLLRG